MNYVIYSLSDPEIGRAIDKYVTGNYGEDFYGADDAGMFCSVCGDEIKSCEEFYDVDGTFFCMHCEKEAEEKIIDSVREEYIFEA
ncbi:MAG: hypothetical protein ACI4EA_04685 [Candidatus Ornithomonoglobus sp.]